MRITEGQLRRIVRSIIKEGSEVDATFEKFKKSCQDFSDPAEIAGAFSEAMESKSGGVSKEESATIKKFHDSLLNGVAGMAKNYQGQMKTGAPDSQKKALEDIHNKVKSYIEKCGMQMSGKKTFI